MNKNIEQFRRRLPINKHRLDDELEIHAQCQDEISDTVARLNTQSLDLKKGLDITESELVEDIKIEEPKLTNPMVEKAARRDPRYLEAWGKYQQAREEHERWSGLLASWVSRGYNLKTLADLHGQQYYSVTDAGPSNEYVVRIDHTSQSPIPRRRPSR